MAYTPQTPQEAQFLTVFNQNLPRITAYKQQHGGDLEGAFEAVTGTPWVAGRSVKLHDGLPEMTKDRTFKSVLGKYVAPIAGGALTALTLGGAAPVLAGMFGGGGAAAGGGVAGGGLGTGALGLGATIPGAGAVSGISGATGGAAALSAGKKIAGLLGDTGTMIAGMADQSAQNRAAEAGRGPADDALAMKNLQHASYIAGGGAQPSTTNPLAGLSSFAGKTLPSYGLTPPPATAGAQSFAQQMEAELRRRMKEGQPLTLSGIAPAGGMERFNNVAAPALGLGGRFANLFSK